MDHQHSQNSGMNDSSSHASSSDPYNMGRSDTYPPDFAEPPAEHLKHSGPGISSFIVGLVGLIGHIMIFVLLYLALYSSFGILDSSISREELALHPAVILSSLAFLVCLILNLAGLVLGIIGLVQKNRRKVFAIIGTIMNGLLILLFTGLVLGGIYMA